MEEMNKEELTRLCFKHGFSWEGIGKYIKIKSKIDTWYVLNLEHEWRKIQLQHQNDKGSAGMHPHKKHDNLKCLFYEIQWHDERFSPMFSKIPGRKIINILNQTNVVYV